MRIQFKDSGAWNDEIGSELQKIARSEINSFDRTADETASAISEMKRYKERDARYESYKSKIKQLWVELDG